MNCENCKTKLTEKVFNYSTKKFQKPLCFECQKKIPLTTKAIISSSSKDTRSICLSYAKDLAVAGTIPIDEILTYSEKFSIYVENGI